MGCFLRNNWETRKFWMKWRLQLAFSHKYTHTYSLTHPHTHTMWSFCPRLLGFSYSPRNIRFWKSPWNMISYQNLRMTKGSILWKVDFLISISGWLRLYIFGWSDSTLRSLFIINPCHMDNISCAEKTSALLVLLLKNVSFWLEMFSPVPQFVGPILLS